MSYDYTKIPTGKPELPPAATDLAKVLTAGAHAVKNGSKISASPTLTPTLGAGRTIGSNPHLPPDPNVLMTQIRLETASSKGVTDNLKQTASAIQSLRERVPSNIEMKFEFQDTTWRVSRNNDRILLQKEEAYQASRKSGLYIPHVQTSSIHWDGREISSMNCLPANIIALIKALPQHHQKSDDAIQKLADVSKTLVQMGGYRKEISNNGQKFTLEIHHTTITLQGPGGKFEQLGPQGPMRFNGKPVSKDNPLPENFLRFINNFHQQMIGK